ncbi:lipocalin-like domain-containing protein [Marinospirillum sp.]|uniref:lipocalin-like domain-containing protein n=1 Tax=Marinospirillum sp. TaxID=2183934 RepID=UPI00384FE189
MLIRILLVLLACVALLACSQEEPPARGFAGLGTSVEGFAQVKPDPQLSFPEDLGSHPDYRIEWWYVTANLTDEQGEEWGVQWTLFRQALQPGSDEDQGWQTPQLWLGHAGLTSRQNHWQSERLARGGIGQAGVTAQPFKAWIDHWQFTSLGDSFSPLSLTAAGDDFAYQLELQTQQPLVLQGEAGYSRKSNQGQASYYYSQPFFEVSGQLQVGKETLQVSGQGWMDREWSSQPLAGNQEGWDWFSLHLDGGDKLMVFQLRDQQGANFHSGTWISAQGEATPLQSEQIQLEPLNQTQVAGRRLPTRWQLTIPDKNLKITTQALNPKAFMDTSIPYWEGPIHFEGSHTGRGFLEMTGY